MIAERVSCPASVDKFRKPGSMRKAASHRLDQPLELARGLNLRRVEMTAGAQRLHRVGPDHGDDPPWVGAALGVTGVVERVLDFVGNQLWPALAGSAST